ncbi:trans-2,3-enoyl-CoA reductase-like [Scleropages formosus]|uniref:trans-2,3-enoyl-CoA reductase-like n=1 Tax=Scleropages formosus TaxID=113540 RepID=UPI0010FA6D2E|nr:trans-2,3-enoyl-CoA reductase-like [Scleropages formosus]
MSLPPRSFYGLSRLILSSGPLGAHLARSHRVSYMEVEVLDQRTGRTIRILDKVQPSWTILDLKNRFHKACPGWYPSRTGLRTEPNGPLLRDSCELWTLGSSSLLTLYTTDLGRQVGWSTVFLSQYMGPLVIYLMFYLRLSAVYDDSVKQRRPLVVHLACFCHSLHYVKHLLETLFVHRLSEGYTPVQNLLKGCAFYWGFTFWLGYYINHPLYTPPYFANKQVIPSFFWFLFCEAGNFFINFALAQHNQTGKSLLYPKATYNPFTWLFLLVHYPQYTYEIGAWISLAVMTQTIPVAVFAALVSIQMLLWARRRHRKHYRQAGHSSSLRTAVIPFLL